MAPPAIDLPISSGPARLYDLPTGEFRFIALDVETANSDRSSICQIGLACVTAGGEITTFSTYVDPEDDFSAGNIRIHGITPDTVHGSPTWPAILPTLVPLLDRAPIVQHSSFDRTAVHAACEKHSLPKPNWHWHDSVRIARKAWPQLTGNGGHGLANLKSFLRLDFAHHDAGEDARAAAQVVLMAEIALGIDCLAPTPRRQPAKRATSARRRPLPETPTWRAAKRAIRNWNGDDPEDLLTAVAATSETLISSIEKDEISYREIVAISDFTSDLLDMIERHLDDAKADPDKSDVVLRVDIARGAAERLDDTVTDLLIEISGVKGRLSQSNP
ncbi:MAG: hypothetical protein DI556_09955 [Rhodovulum sulfidophilum]|uniref:Exonuclease domain-containing protein n=1 Tax=Rhodovulum sulfidophilum TaxID=35806 RepID=A0A2W5NGR7_RHOSU|nr:MAG: hypothetical protein DI556_09955 [Rhodovulum sulfidophilum]